MLANSLRAKLTKKRRHSIDSIRRNSKGNSITEPILPSFTTTVLPVEASTDAINGLQLMLQMQRDEIATKNLTIENLKANSQIQISTVEVKKLIRTPNFNDVAAFKLQWDIPTHLKVLEHIGTEARQSIEYQANKRGLAEGNSWMFFPEAEMLTLIVACFPQLEKIILPGTAREN